MDSTPPQLTELPTPLQLVNSMERAMYYARLATKTIGDPEAGLRRVAVDAKNAYSKACKLWLKDHGSEVGGSRDDRLDAAQLANWEMYEAMVDADLALQYAREKGDDLKSELSKLQSQSRLVIKEMELAR